MIDSQYEEKRQSADGERHLLAAVLGLAVEDASKPIRDDEKHESRNIQEGTESAVKFLFGDGFKIYASALDLSASNMLMRLIAPNSKAFAGKKLQEKLSKARIIRIRAKWAGIDVDRYKSDAADSD